MQSCDLTWSMTGTQPLADAESSMNENDSERPAAPFICRHFRSAYPVQSSYTDPVITG